MGVESAMDAVKELEAVLTLDQAHGLTGFDTSPALDRGSSTQQLLDDLLGRLEDDDSLMFLR